MKGKEIALKRRGRTKGGRGSLPAKINWLHGFPCDICGAMPVEVHHDRRLGSRAMDERTIPLCPGHHRIGPWSVQNLGRGRFQDFFNYDIATRCAYWQERWETQ